MDEATMERRLLAYPRPSDAYAVHYGPKRGDFPGELVCIQYFKNPYIDCEDQQLLDVGFTAMKLAQSMPALGT